MRTSEIPGQNQFQLTSPKSEKIGALYKKQNPSLKKYLIKLFIDTYKEILSNFNPKQQNFETFLNQIFKGE